MSLSRASLVERAYLRNQSQGGAAAAVPLARYDALEPQARAILARRVAADESLRGLLQKDFTLTITSGTCALATHLTTTEPLLLECLRWARITSADSSYAWQYLPDYMTLSLERTQYGLIYYAITGSSLDATDTSGTLSSLSTTATARACYVPLASSLSGNLDLEEMAVSCLAELAMGEMKAQAA